MGRELVKVGWERVKGDGKGIRGKVKGSGMGKG